MTKEDRKKITSLLEKEGTLTWSQIYNKLKIKNSGNSLNANLWILRNNNIITLEGKNNYSLVISEASDK